MNKEFFVALDLLEKERKIPKEYMLEKIEAALLSALKKEYGSRVELLYTYDPTRLSPIEKLFGIQKESPVETGLSLYDAYFASVTSATSAASSSSKVL